MKFITDVVHNVRDIDKARTLLVDKLDFHIESENESCTIINNGAITIRLTADGNRDEGKLYLSMETKEMDEICQHLINLAFTTVDEERWITTYRKERHLQGPHGIHIILARTYNEDELGIVPELSTNLEWSDEARLATKKLLAHVPISFRDTARLKVTKQAEADAIVEGVTTVNLDLAMNALVIATPAFRLDHLKSSMGDLGIDPTPYFVESDAPDA